MLLTCVIMGMDYINGPILYKVGTKRLQSWTSRFCCIGFASVFKLSTISSTVE